ncbi:hypothetical protein [Streptomyces sp. B6B3]|uniref:hypothetical protein n=1 Tax=Streptomyces sp. B6B3 TaxID=3153570 RepID=UPI00325D4659
MSGRRRSGAVRLLAGLALATLLPPAPAANALPGQPQRDAAGAPAVPGPDGDRGLAVEEAAAESSGGLAADDTPEDATDDTAEGPGSGAAEARGAGPEAPAEPPAEDGEEPGAGAGPAPDEVSAEDTATGEGDFGGTPAGDELAASLAELRTGYEEAEAAEEAYREAADRLRAVRERVESVSHGLAEIRTELAEAQRLAGLLARQQYQDGGLELPAALRLLLGEEPALEPHDQAVADRAVAAHVATLEALREEERKTDRRAREERAALDAAQAVADELRGERDDARDRLDDAAAALASLAEPAPTLPDDGLTTPEAGATRPGA